MVTEISSKNELVVLDTFEAPPPLSPVDTSTAESVNTDTAESAVSGKVARPDASTVPQLLELVKPEHYHSLQQLAFAYKTTLVHDPDQRVDLGKWVW